MNHSPLISVIVPVYKVEAYLDKCVQSIVDQTYRDLEIILVDDGSPDNCPAMCDAWAKKDSRIKVIHQENAGGGAARNAGLDAAAGDWIAFVDSDDYLCADMYAHLAAWMEAGADIAECGYLSVTGDDAEFPQENPASRQYTAREAMQEHIYDRTFRQLLWNKLYRREVIGNIRFPVGKQIDDEFFMYQVLGNARNLVHSGKICYAYRQQPGSVMHNLTPEKRLQAVEAKCLRHDYLQVRFPELIPDSLQNLWFTCLYHGQLTLRESGGASVLPALENILRTYPLTALPPETRRTHRLWLMLAQISFTGVCKLRNILGVGL